MFKTFELMFSAFELKFRTFELKFNVSEHKLLLRLKTFSPNIYNSFS